jgi:acyl carrier protein
MSPADDSIELARGFVARVLERPLDAVPADGTVDTIAAWDSMGHVRILLAIEEKTGRPLDSEIIASLRSVADVARALAAG